MRKATSPVADAPLLVLSYATAQDTYVSNAATVLLRPSATY